MKVLRKWLAAPLATLMLLSGLSLAAPAAQAAPGCTLGWACVWRDANYGGPWAAAPADGFLSKASDKGGTAKYQSNSAWANGNACHRTSFRTGSRNGDKFFILDSETRVGSNYRDPNLANGAGRGDYSGENWKNRVRYIRFFDGPNCK